MATQLIMDTKLKTPIAPTQIARMNINRLANAR